MRAKLISICSSVFILLVTTGMTAQAENLKDVEITDEFPLERCITSPGPGLTTSCTDSDCNQYLPLIPDRVWTLDNSNCEDCDEEEAVQVSILDGPDDTPYIGDPLNPDYPPQQTRVMEETEWVDSVLTEVSRNFLNQCSNTQDVYYWGEDVCVHPDSDGVLEGLPIDDHFDCNSIVVEEEGEPDVRMVPGQGAWRAGIDDAEPGILFPGGAFIVGARYFQEVAPNALDWAENAEMGLSFDDPAAEDDFEDCVVVLDRNLLEDPKSKEADEKIYCPDIGIVQDEEMELTSCTDGGGACTQ